MHMLTFYVPERHLETVKEALFNVGAGRIGNYDSCCWQTTGSGQFRPLSGSNPHLGDVNEVYKAPEFKVEMVCDDKLIKDAIKTLLQVHPFETPAYQVWRLSDY